MKKLTWVIWKAAYHLVWAYLAVGMMVARTLIISELAWVSCGAAAGGVDVQHVFKKLTASKMAIHTFRKINYMM